MRVWGDVKGNSSANNISEINSEPVGRPYFFSRSPSMQSNGNLSPTFGYLSPISEIGNG